MRSFLVASCPEIRSLDLALERDLGLGPAELMEIAGFGCFLMIRDLLAGAKNVVIAAGPGQNGGDGFVVARHARASGCEVSVFAMKEPVSGSAAAIHRRRLEPFGVPVSVGDLDALERALASPETVAIDALYGIGLSFPLRPEAARWIGGVARASDPIVSIDLPSGMDGDSGEAPSGGVRASVTLTIGALKPGLLTPGGARRAGKIEVVPLPYPPRLVAHLARARC